MNLICFCGMGVVVGLIFVYKEIHMFRPSGSTPNHLAIWTRELTKACSQLLVFASLHESPKHMSL